MILDLLGTKPLETGVQSLQVKLLSGVQAEVVELVD